MAGYSGTPLVKKLGIKEGNSLVLVSAPTGFTELLEGLPRSVQVSDSISGNIDVAILFATKKADLERKFERLAMAVTGNGMIWVAWPKKASGVTGELSEESVQKIGLSNGLVDVKICAIDDTWSGLKFVIRKADRAQRAAAK